MKIKKAYLTMQEASGIKVGDTVKVLRKAESYEMGWDQMWVPEMGDMIGKEEKVTSAAYCGGFELGRGGAYFPFFVLEKIEPEELKFTMVIEVIAKDQGSEESNAQYVAGTYDDTISYMKCADEIIGVGATVKIHDDKG